MHWPFFVVFAKLFATAQPTIFEKNPQTLETPLDYIVHTFLP